jgi:hypothetical protein
MKVRLFPAVHGHIADSVRAGPVARRTASPPVVPVFKGLLGGSAASGRSLKALVLATQSPPDPSAGAAPPAGPGSGGGLAKAVAAPQGALRPGPRCSAPQLDPRRIRLQLPVCVDLRWTCRRPAVDLHVPGDLAPILAEVKYQRYLRIPAAGSAMPPACSAHQYPGVTRQGRCNE